jgi:hypothetical protein
MAAWPRCASVQVPSKPAAVQTPGQLLLEGGQGGCGGDAPAAALSFPRKKSKPSRPLGQYLAGKPVRERVKAAPVSALTRGVLRVMHVSKLKVVAVVLGIAVVGLGAGLAAAPAPAPEGATADVKVREAELQVKRAELEQAKAAAEQAKAGLERGKRLPEARAISQQEFDDLNAAADAAAKRVRVQEAEVRLAEARRGEKAAPAPKEADARDAVELAEARVLVQRARTEAAQGELETAQAAQARLAKFAPGEVSEQDRAQAEAEVRAKEGQLRIRKAEQGEAEVLLRQARRRLDGAADRLGELERKVEELRKEVEALKKLPPPEGRNWPSASSLSSAWAAERRTGSAGSRSAPRRRRQAEEAGGRS